MTHPRSAVAPVHLSQLPVTTTPHGTNRIAMQTATDGGFTVILDWPGPIMSANADKGFEYHTGHEEIFLLDGSRHFHDH